VIDVTAEVNDYREAVRNLWNTHFLRVINRISEGEAIELFERVSETVFDALVLRPWNIKDCAENLNSLPFPSLFVFAETLRSDHFMIHRFDDNSSYWDAAPDEVDLKNITLQLIGFFDWDQFGHIDLRYVRVRICECSQMPVLVGKDALIDVSYAKIFYRSPT
jgi:hypothetical protein